MDEKLEKARQVKRAHEKEWLAIEGVVAIGIGIVQNGEPGIVISTKVAPSAMPRAIPEIVDDVHIEVRQSGEITAL